MMAVMVLNPYWTEKALAEREAGRREHARRSLGRSNRHHARRPDNEHDDIRWFLSLCSSGRYSVPNWATASSSASTSVIDVERADNNYRDLQMSLSFWLARQSKDRRHTLVRRVRSSPGSGQPRRPQPRKAWTSMPRSAPERSLSLTAIRGSSNSISFAGGKMRLATARSNSRATGSRA